MTTVSRTQLYDLVWAEPMQRLAARFNISSVALAKRCRRLNVPVPPRGYWAKRAAGKEVRAQRLPPPRTPQEHTPIHFVKRTRREPVQELREGPVWEQAQFEARQENRIVLRERLSRHPVVRATAVSLRQARGAQATIVNSYGDNVIGVAVSRQLVTRALRFLDTLVNACETRGFVVRGAMGHNDACHVTVLAQTLPLRLREPTRRVDLLKEEGKTPKPNDWRYSRYRFEGSGRLELHIGSAYSVARSVWRDSKRERIEDCLNEIMVTLVAGAVALIDEDARQKRVAEERERIERLESETAAQHEKEELRIQQLVADSKGWARSEKLRAFANAIETELGARSDLPQPIEISGWLSWVHHVADDTDPLVLADPFAFVSREPPPPRPAWMR